MTGPLEHVNVLYFKTRYRIASVANLQIRTTNANVDNGSELLASETLPLTAANLLRELLHVVQNSVDTVGAAHDILTINLHFHAANIAQGSVVDSTVLSEVDLVATEHGIALALNTSLLGELDKQLEGLVGQEVLAEVEEDIIAGAGGSEGASEAVEAVWVGSEGLLEDEALADVVAVSIELGPGGESVGGSHFEQLKDMEVGGIKIE